MKKSEKIGENESELIKKLKKDEKLRENPDFRMEMLALASLFLENFAENIYKTSIELNSSGGAYSYYSIDAWKEFLNYPIVRKYIQSFKDEKVSMITDQGLAKGDKDAASIKKVMEASGPSVNNSNYILIRLPEKREEFLED